ncbi:MAG: hypothetical protein H7834_08070 [Magnetococcus sp. YQC-9]
MQLLNRLRTLLGRFPLYMALGVMVAMPISGYYLLSAHQAHQEAVERVDKTRKRAAEQMAFNTRANEYHKYLDELQRFSQAVTKNRLDERQGWTRFAVEIKERLVTEEELRVLLNQLTPTDRYYFKPGKLEITSLTAREGLPPRLLARMQGKEKGTEPVPLPGEKVLLSLTGHYLVFPPG